MLPAITRRIEQAPQAPQLVGTTDHHGTDSTAAGAHPKRLPAGCDTFFRRQTNVTAELEDSAVTFVTLPITSGRDGGGRAPGHARGGDGLSYGGAPRSTSPG
ncbi:hypothetical protein GCM10009557_19200 [Virgisporangium ochraceum]|uniref:Uncharacterized protein n=1 Tax=Virgisporangium ochraceum TaxID=65505 RepID=A0A8J3ZUH5_9ACTN|nr:hypothetical protein Voc01_041340 [Virgisporangium ochraceum]